MCVAYMDIFFCFRGSCFINRIVDGKNGTQICCTCVFMSYHNPTSKFALVDLN